MHAAVCALADKPPLFPPHDLHAGQRPLQRESFTYIYLPSYIYLHLSIYTRTHAHAHTIVSGRIEPRCRSELGSARPTITERPRTNAPRGGRRE